MSLFLTVIPLYGGTSELAKTGGVYRPDSLTFLNDHETTDQFLKSSGPFQTLKPRTVPKGFKITIFSGETVNVDSYGEALTWLPASAFRKLRLQRDKFYARDKAIKAFLLALPKDTPIVLYWH